MNAHIPRPPHQIRGVREPASTMVPVHGHGDDCTCPTCARLTAQTLALERLSTFVEDEGESLDHVLRLLDLRGGRADLEALYDLHVEPGTENDALRDAMGCLERMVDDLAEVPTSPRVGPALTAPDAAIMRDLDGRVRWLGARTQDVLSMVRRARV